MGAAGDAVVYAYASTTFDQAQLDLFRSTDGGLNWTALGLAAKRPLNFDYFQRDMNLMADQAFYNQMLLVDPTDASRNAVYLGGQLASANVLAEGPDRFSGPPLSGLTFHGETHFPIADRIPLFSA